MNLPVVTLREYTLDDVEDRYQWSLDKEVTRHLVVPDQYPPFTREDTRNWIEMCINRSNGYEQRAVITEAGKHIGWADLKNFDKPNLSAEMGIAIGNKEYWGKGYGAAALKEILKLGFQKFHLHKVWLRVDVDNEPAIKSYRRAGFVEEGIMRQDRLRQGKFIDRLRMSILNKEYEDKQGELGRKFKRNVQLME